MNPAQQLAAAGQSLWLDNISRELLSSGTLSRYIAEYGVTGLTSNPTIFEQAIKNGGAYDEAIREKTREGKRGEALFFELALEDLVKAADLFKSVHEATLGVDGWVSLEVSPLLVDNAEGTSEAAQRLYKQAQRDNIFIKIPGTAAGVAAIEDAIFAGVPVNVTLLFSPNQYIAAAEAYLRGIERRIAAGLAPAVCCVASLFVSRWDTAANELVTADLRNRLGIAIAQCTYHAYRALLASERWQKLAAAGALPQRLLWASTGTKDPALPDTFYIDALAVAGTINTIPEKTLLAFADHGAGKTVLTSDSAAAEKVVAEFVAQGVNIDLLAAQLQQKGAAAFTQSWRTLMQCIADKQT